MFFSTWIWQLTRKLANSCWNLINHSAQVPKIGYTQAPPFKQLYETYGRAPLKYGPLYRGLGHSSAVTVKEHASHFEQTHDDVIKWKHFPRYWPFVRGIHRSPVNSPHKGQWRGALIFPLICAWINGWVNNRKAGDLRLHRAHYHVIVMKIPHIDGLAQERRNSSALAMELRLSCTKPSIYGLRRRVMTTPHCTMINVALTKRTTNRFGITSPYTGMKSTREVFCTIINWKVTYKRTRYISGILREPCNLSLQSLYSLCSWDRW